MNLQEAMADLDLHKSYLDQAVDNYGLGNESINVKSFLGHISELTSRARKVISMLLGQADQSPTGSVVVGFKSAAYNLNSSVSKVNWIVMGETVGFKAVGQSALTLDVVDLMVQHCGEVDACLEAIKATNREMGKYILDLSLLNKFTPMNGVTNKTAKEFIKEFSGMFKGPDGIDRDAFDRLYKSYAQFNKTSDSLDMLTNKLNNSSVKTLHAEMSALDDTLDKLIFTINQGAEGRVIDNNAAKKLGDMIYNLADWTAIGALYLTKLIAVNKAHVDNVDRLNELTA